MPTLQTITARPMILGLCVVLMLTSGCVPAPRTPLATARLRAPQFATVRGALVRAGLHPGAWPHTHWWRRFHDPVLSKLIRQGLRVNGSMKAARAHIRAAAAAYRLASAGLKPGLSAGASVERERASATGLVPPPFAGTTVNDGRVGLSAHEDLSFWDARHAALAQALGRWAATRAAAAEIRLVISTEIAERYFALTKASRDRQAARSFLHMREHMGTLLEARYKAGINGGLTAASEQISVASARLQLSLAHMAVRERQFALAALLGRGPAFAHTLSSRQTTALPRLTVPDHVRIDLIARRPDVQVRYWQVKAAEAGRKVARARFYPNISLNAGFGFESITLSRLLNPANIAAHIGPAINLPLFDGGANRAQLSISRAHYNAAVARYNATIIHAANHVASDFFILAAVQHQWQDTKLRARAAARSLRLMRLRFKAGLIGILPLQKATLATITAEKAEKDARIRILEAYVTVIKSLGGGYRASSFSLPHKTTTQGAP